MFPNPTAYPTHVRMKSMVPFHPSRSVGFSTDFAIDSVLLVAELDELLS